uniref:DR1 associated protein 1 n=1 Tax=Eptatretus burgeri TaxID=7764 RepID=A0A8C4NDY3_EPTBU
QHDISKKYSARYVHVDQACMAEVCALPTSARALELFLESLLTKTCQVTQSRNAKTMTTSHLKQCIESEQQYDFLKDLVAGLPDMQGDREEAGNDGDKSIKRCGALLGVWRRNANGGGAGKVKDKQSESDTDQEVRFHVRVIIIIIIIIIIIVFFFFLHWHGGKNFN